MNELPQQIQNKYNLTLFNTPYEINKAIVLKHSAIVLLISSDKVRVDHWVENGNDWKLCKKCR